MKKILYSEISTIDSNFINKTITTVALVLMVMSIIFYLLLKFYITNLDESNIGFELIIKEFWYAIAPERLERALYLLVTLVTPLVCIVVAELLYQSKYQIKLRGEWLNFLNIAISILMLCMLYNGAITRILLGGFYNESLHIIRWYILSFCITWFFLFYVNIISKTSNINNIVFALFIIIAVVQIFSWRVYSVHTLISDDANHNLDPIAYVISQVVGEKKILVDLPSQYGMYPVLLKYVFQWINLTILNLTIVFAIFQIVSLCFVFFVMQKLLKSVYLQVLLGLILIIITGESSTHIAGYSDPYFQYWPIRFLGPAISLLFFYKYINYKSYKNVIYLAIISSLSFIWNLDTGIVIAFTFVSFLMVNLLYEIRQIIFSKSFKNKNQIINLIIQLIIFVSFTVIIIIAYYLILTIENPQGLKTNWILGYQKVFYDLGFYMIPIPLIRDPWIAIYFTYILGLAVSFSALLYNQKSHKIEIILFLSILGLGLFSYYQGRSHPLNLIKVLWPALLIVLTLTDSLIRRLSDNRSEWYAYIAPTLVIATLNLPAATLLMSMPKAFNDFNIKLSYSEIYLNEIIEDELNFIRSITQDNKECVILTNRQGIYNLELGLISPIKGPGIVETILVKDQDDLISALKNENVNCIIINNDNKFLNADGVLSNYKKISSNNKKTLIYLRQNYISQ